MSWLERICSWFKKEPSTIPFNSGFEFTKRSLKKLDGVNEDLVLVTKRALKLSTVDFAVTEGVRTRARQNELVAAGKSWTKNSRHITGHAVDVMASVNEKGSWAWKHYPIIAEAFKQAAYDLDIEIKWGGDWKQRDGVHFELDRKYYK
jgi:peptidoglycan L-alanyl-D-glutamate endopeptidase CwlK